MQVLRPGFERLDTERAQRDRAHTCTTFVNSCRSVLLLLTLGACGILDSLVDEGLASVDFHHLCSQFRSLTTHHIQFLLKLFHAFFLVWLTECSQRREYITWARVFCKVRSNHIACRLQQLVARNLWVVQKIEGVVNESNIPGRLLAGSHASPA